jgi:putative component of membrane protein insertase Oxa1/YidC/SpoIIIJ protein YidD
MLNHSLAAAITSYQKYLSPYKGFCCAYRVKHGEASCSEFVKQTLLEYGVWRAIPAVKQRFKDCKTASLTLRTDANNQRRSGDNARNGSNQRRSNTLDYCECCSPVELIPSEGCSASEILGGGADACSCSL